MGTHLALGKVGLWTASLRVSDTRPTQQVKDTTAELEELGYGAIWFGGSPGTELLAPLLDATSRITIATGIITIWEREAADLADWFHSLDSAYDGRFLLGLGVSHSKFVERYRRPLAAMREYLTGLDSAPKPVPASKRVLAALGPKMLELSRDRAAGAHPYLVTAEYVAEARETLGPDALLAPELKVVLDTDPDQARATARAYISGYLQLPNYTRNLLRLGFTEDDFRDGGSERLLTSVFALGDPEAVRGRVDEFLTAGADHLAVQVVTGDPSGDPPIAQWRTLAKVLPLGE